jgi:hypothetical protein
VLLLVDIRLELALTSLIENVFLHINRLTVRFREGAPVSSHLGLLLRVIFTVGRVMTAIRIVGDVNLVRELDAARLSALLNPGRLWFQDQRYQALVSRESLDYFRNVNAGNHVWRFDEWEAKAGTQVDSTSAVDKRRFYIGERRAQPMLLREYLQVASAFGFRKFCIVVCIVFCRPSHVSLRLFRGNTRSQNGGLSAQEPQLVAVFLGNGVEHVIQFVEGQVVMLKAQVVDHAVERVLVDVQAAKAHVTQVSLA